MFMGIPAHNRRMLGNQDGYTARVTPILSAPIRRFLIRLLSRILLSAIVLAGLAYAADYAVFRYRVAHDRQPFGQVTVTHYDAVQQKNGKTEFIFDPPQTQTCVNSLFPHAGYTPCWYLQSHTEQRTDI
jgi:hypothetical protein